VHIACSPTDFFRETLQPIVPQLQVPQQGESSHAGGHFLQVIAAQQQLRETGEPRNGVGKVGQSVLPQVEGLQGRELADAGREGAFQGVCRYV